MSLLLTLNTSTPCSRVSIFNFEQVNTGWADAYLAFITQWWSFFAKIVNDKKPVISNIARLSLMSGGEFYKDPAKSNYYKLLLGGTEITA